MFNRGIYKETNLSNDTTMPSSSEVLPGLFVGSAQAAIMPDVERFGSIINVTEEVPFSKCLEPHVETHRFNIMHLGDFSEQQAMVSIFERAMPVIEACLTTAAPALIHCAYGEQRSCTLLVAFLVWKHEYSLSEAMQIVKNAHRPAFGCGTYVHFQDALQAWEKQCLA